MCNTLQSLWPRPEGLNSMFDRVLLYNLLLNILKSSSVLSHGMTTITDDCVNTALQDEENNRNLTRDEMYDKSDAFLHCLADQNMCS